MARTARVRREETTIKTRQFQVGIYARLSVEGDERKNESIDTQVAIAKQYIKEHQDLTLYDIYSDLGATGKNFEREGFQRMMQDIRKRRIDCVIVKDLSRFGRNAVETGNYIQKIFPFMDVRFIAVSDNLDTFEQDKSADDLVVNLKNLVNELYAKDIAEKVKASKRAAWEKGSYLGSVPPYGYEAKWADGKKKLFVEPETAGIVKEIYRMFLDGTNMVEITRILFKKRIHRPSTYRSTGHIYQQEDETLEAWTEGAVKGMLTNPVYIGTLVYGLTCGKKYEMRDLHNIDKEDVHIQMNTHEPIITEDVFYAVGKKFEQTAKYSNKKGFNKVVPLDENIYMDVLYCGNCGKKMTRTSNSKTFSSGDRVRWYGYFCTNKKAIDKSCTTNTIAKTALDELVLTALEQEFNLSGMRAKDLVVACKTQTEEQIKSLRKQISDMQSIYDNRKKCSSDIYLRYRAGELSVSEYQMEKEKIENAGNEAKKQINIYNTEIRRLEIESEEKGSFMRNLMKCKKKNVELTRDIIDTLIKRIEVYENHVVKIAFTFHMNELVRKELENVC